MIGDTRKRKAYDQGKSDDQDGEVDAEDESRPDWSLSDMLSSTGGNGKSSMAGQIRHPPIFIEAQITFIEAVEGALKKVKFQRVDRCPLCKGVGGTNVKKCAECAGAGVLTRSTREFTEYKPCEACNGFGKIPRAPCKYGIYCLLMLP